MGMLFKTPEAALDVTAPEWAANHPAWLRLENQLHWYDLKSVSCQGWYKKLKIMQVAFAVLIPVMNLLPIEYAKWAMAVAGSIIALLEAVQHMNQYSTLWVTYRSTAERLKHEKYLFLSAAGPYREMPETDRLVQLAERVEEHVSTEHANWFNETRRNPGAEKKKEAAL